MSDPFSDPNASPWTSSGEPVAPPSWAAPPPPGDGGDRWAPSGQGPPDGDGWSQPPRPPGGGEQPWGSPPQGEVWGQPPGQQPPWGQQPQWGQPPPVGDQWGQQPYGPPPQKSNTGKIVAIVLGVFVLLGLGIVGAAVFLFSTVAEEVGDLGGIVEGLDQLEDGAGVPAGPRLLEATGTIEGSGDAVRYEFSVADRTDVQIDVVARGGFDPIVTLLDSRGDQILEDDDGGQGFDSRISTDLGSGDYVIEVRGFASTSGSFDVIVTDR